MKYVKQSPQQDQKYDNKLKGPHSFYFFCVLISISYILHLWHLPCTSLNKHEQSCSVSPANGWLIVSLRFSLAIHVLGIIVGTDSELPINSRYSWLRTCMEHLLISSYTTYCLIPFPQIPLSKPLKLE